jgi:hypothetical protein
MEQNEIDGTRLDRIEHSVNQIKSAIIGNEFSGGIGLIHSVKDIKERMDKTEDEMAVLKENMNILKWIARSIGTIIIGSIAYLIQKK